MSHILCSLTVSWSKWASISLKCLSWHKFKIWLVCISAALEYLLLLKLELVKDKSTQSEICPTMSCLHCQFYLATYRSEWNWLYKTERPLTSISFFHGNFNEKKNDNGRCLSCIVSSNGIIERISVLNTKWRATQNKAARTIWQMKIVIQM